MTRKVFMHSDVDDSQKVELDEGQTIVWTLDRAVFLVRKLQPELHARKYHVALGGGVLNKGWSTKDLDLYVFAFNNEETTEPVLTYLESVLGPSSNIYEEREGYENNSGFTKGRKFLQYPGGRIDVFILSQQEVDQ